MSDSIEKQVVVRCSVEHAFEVFTDRIDLWWPLSHRPKGATRLVLGAEVGGRLYATMAAGDALMGEVIECEVPSRI
jgi:hypothetical protein